MVRIGRLPGRDLPEAEPESLGAGLPAHRARLTRKPSCSRGSSKSGFWMLIAMLDTSAGILPAFV